LPPTLEIQQNAVVQPAQALPGTGRMLPPLRAIRLRRGVLPYELNPAGAVPLYRVPFRDFDAGVPWTGATNVASIDTDRRVGLLTIQLFTNNRLDFTGAEGDDTAPRRAVQYILESLEFPGQPVD
jgi:hypothetical protein